MLARLTCYEFNQYSFLYLTEMPLVCSIHPPLSGMTVCLIKTLPGVRTTGTNSGSKSLLSSHFSLYLHPSSPTEWAILATEVCSFSSGRNPQASPLTSDFELRVEVVDGSYRAGAPIAYDLHDHDDASVDPVRLLHVCWPQVGLPGSCAEAQVAQLLEHEARAG